MDIKLKTRLLPLNTSLIRKSQKLKLKKIKSNYKHGFVENSLFIWSNKFLIGF